MSRAAIEAAYQVEDRIRRAIRYADEILELPRATMEMRGAAALASAIRERLIGTISELRRLNMELSTPDTPDNF